MVDPRNQQLVK